MCSYNREYIITNAIKSLLRQDFDDWELIIVDDGSKDNTINVIIEYINRFNMINNSNIADKKNKNLQFFEIENLEIKNLDKENIKQTLGSIKQKKEQNTTMGASLYNEKTAQPTLKVPSTARKQVTIH